MNSSLAPGRTAEPICRRLQPGDAAALAELFTRLREHGFERYFHPHPLTAAAATQRAAYSGRDVYCVVQQGGDLVGYGLLRGWDEGYAVPSLGIAIDPASQRSGLGRRLMEYLHEAARQQGATRVRLRVYPENAPAVRLYQTLGYVFSPEREADGQLTGFLELAGRKPGAAGEGGP